MSNEDMIISIASSLGHLSSRLDQVEANIMQKVETEIRLVRSEFNHLEEKFNTEVLRGDQLFSQGIEKLEAHEEKETEKFERHKETVEQQIDHLFGKVRATEERQAKLETKIHEIEIKPALDLYKKIDERKGEGWKVAIAVLVTGGLAILWDIIKG